VIVVIARTIGRHHGGTSADERSFLTPFPGCVAAGPAFAQLMRGALAPSRRFHMGKTRFRHVKCDNVAAQHVFPLGRI
jgi:hypothetical protein